MTEYKLYKYNKKFLLVCLLLFCGIISFNTVFLTKVKAEEAVVLTDDSDDIVSKMQTSFPDDANNVAPPMVTENTDKSISLVGLDDPNSELSKTLSDDETPWQLSADKVTGYNQNSIIEAEGGVYLRQNDQYLKADFARYYTATGWVYLKGNVDVFFGKDNIIAEEAEFDLNTSTGWLKNGRVFMGGPHVYMTGEKIQKESGELYKFNKAKVTTCDGDSPAWSVFADEAIVEIDGYARLWGTSFAIKDQSLMYSPFMILPVKKDRQSGFLVPTFGQSSRKGFIFNPTYFWAINDSSDLTLNTELMTKRGVMLGVEYRARPDVNQDIWLRFDWLKDNIADKDTSGYGSARYIRKNSNRYWLRGMYDGVLPGSSRWKVKANLDYVSDQDFLKEFHYSEFGYNYTLKALERNFNRSLQPWSNYRTSEVVIYREWERATFAASARYQQNQYLGHGNALMSESRLAQRLPSLDLYLHKGKLFQDFEVPILISGEAQTVYFYRAKGTQGSRFDFAPRVSVPWITPYFAIEPTIGVRETFYATDRQDTSLELGNQKGSSRTVPEFSIAAFSEVSKIYSLGSSLTVSEADLGNTELTGLRHSIQPRIEYKKRPEIKQITLPYYDSIDHLAPQDELIYSITNVFGVRNDRVVQGRDKKIEIRPQYKNILWVKLEQGYDFEEGRRNWELKRFPRKPLKDVYLEVIYNPLNYLSLQSRNWFSLYTGSFTRNSQTINFMKQGLGDVGLTLDIRDTPEEYIRWSKNLSEREVALLYSGDRDLEEYWINYDRVSRRTLNAKLNLTYFQPFSFAFSGWYDLKTRRERKREVGITYNHQCFAIYANTIWDNLDVSYGFKISLPGFWN